MCVCVGGVIWSKDRKKVENEIALLMNPNRILQLQHSSADPVHGSPK